jgi:hypothetical protein
VGILIWIQEAQAFSTQERVTESLINQLTLNSEPQPQTWWQSFRTFQLTKPLASPLKVYIETHPRETNLFKRRYERYVRESLEQWAEALNGRLLYTITDNPRMAHIQIHWVRSLALSDQDGETQFHGGKAGIKIKIPGVPEPELRMDILHELGHALGIVGHSKNANDVMAEITRWTPEQLKQEYRPVLTTRDKQAIQRLYSPNWQHGEDLYAVR